MFAKFRSPHAVNTPLPLLTFTALSTDKTGDASSAYESQHMPSAHRSRDTKIKGPLELGVESLIRRRETVFVGFGPMGGKDSRHVLWGDAGEGCRR